MFVRVGARIATAVDRDRMCGEAARGASRIGAAQQLLRHALDGSAKLRVFLADLAQFLFGP